MLCHEAGSRNDASWGGHVPTNVPAVGRDSVGHRGPGYGRFGDGAMCRVCRPSGAVGVGVVDDSARQAIEKGEAGPELLHLVELEQQHRDGQRRLLQDGLPQRAPVRRQAEPEGVAAGRMLLPRLEDDSAAIFDYRADSDFWGGTLQTERANFEASWGRCHSEGGRGVLVALPYSDLMPCTLRERMFALLKRMECANPGWNLHLALFDEPFSNEMDARRTKKSGRGVLAHIRNIVIRRFLDPTIHEYVLWVDADVVDYPADLISRLHAANPGGVTAPLVLIEGSDSEEYHSRCRRGICGGAQQHERHAQFYDRAAFIVSGTNITLNPSFPGNARPFPPYLGDEDAWAAAAAGSPAVIDCESVGTVYMLPARAYTAPAAPAHVPTAFTEHFPVVHYAKYTLGLRVVLAIETQAFHANLPTHGEKWHKEPMTIWADWLQPYLGKSLADPAIRGAPPPGRFASATGRFACA